MEINKDNINDLFIEWMRYREEDIAYLTEEDKEHLPNFDEKSEHILKSVYPNRRNYIKVKLEDLYDDIMDYASYWDKKCYKTGFADGIKLILSVLM